ncbi:MAG: hypothetical protein N2746_07450 [Deltaproteobacteria bacterium]|nr:hypothetical protein [Deltaproteobacteria bacterium]
MNILIILLFVYLSATLAALSSHQYDFHRLNLPLYAYVIFYTLVFIPLVLFMHVFYQSYVFMYFFSNLLMMIYPYRLYITILFVIIYYVIFFLVFRITEKTLIKGGRHSIYLRITFFTIITLFLLTFLYKRVVYIGTIQDYLSGTLKPIYKSVVGFLSLVYIVLLLLFDRLVIPRIKRVTL